MFVYLIAQADDHRLVKIGFSKSPAARAKALGSGLIVLASVPCCTSNHAYYVEQRAHHFFADARHIGEWFVLGDGTRNAIKVIEMIAAESSNRFAHEMPQPPAEIAGDGQALSRAEAEVFHLYGSGLGSTDIAVKLGKSVKTISTYASRIAAKMGYSHASEVKVAAIRAVAMQKVGADNPSAGVTAGNFSGAPN